MKKTARETHNTSQPHPPLRPTSQRPVVEKHAYPQKKQATQIKSAERHDGRKLHGKDVGDWRDVCALSFCRAPCPRKRHAPSQTQTHWFQRLPRSPARAWQQRHGLCDRDFTDMYVSAGRSPTATYEQAYAVMRSDSPRYRPSAPPAPSAEFPNQGGSNEPPRERQEHGESLAGTVSRTGMPLRWPTQRVVTLQKANGATRPIRTPPWKRKN